MHSIRKYFGRGKTGIINELVIGKRQRKSKMTLRYLACAFG